MPLHSRCWHALADDAFKLMHMVRRISHADKHAQLPNADFGAAVTAAVASGAAAEAPADSPSVPAMQQTVGVEALEREAAAELETLNATPQVATLF
jgi:hypothetical protein